MPAIYLFGKRTLLGGDDLHVPAFATVIVRFIQLSCLLLPLSFFIWKEAITFSAAIHNNNNNNNWPVWKYLFDWWNEISASSSSSSSQSPPSCTESYFSRYYPFLSSMHLLYSILFCFFSLVLEYRIWYWSCQGTPTMRQPRTTKVQQLLEQKISRYTIILAVILITTYYFAASCFAKPYHQCYIQTLLFYDGTDDSTNDGTDDSTDDSTRNSNNTIYWVGSKSWYGLGALLAVSQTAEVIISTLFYARLKTSTTTTTTTAANNNNDIDGDNNATIMTTSAISGGISHHHNHHLGLTSTARNNSTVHHHELIEELWADRCQLLFRCLSVSTCFLFGGHDLMNNNAQRNNSYRHVAQALADYLETKGTLDVVPTDLVTGLFCVQRIQRQRMLQTLVRRSVLYNGEESSSSLMASLSLMTTTLTTTISTTITTNIGNGNGLGGVGAGDGAGDGVGNGVGNGVGPISILTTSHDITKTGLRSRANSTTDLVRGRTATPPPPLPETTTTTTTTIDTPVTNQVVQVVVPASSLTPSSSSLIRPPQQQQQKCRRPIYRRRHPSLQNNNSQDNNKNNFGIDIDVSSSSNNNNNNNSHNNNGSFYRATSRQVLNSNDPVDVSTLEEGARMADYALSIYTWMLYVFVHPVTGFPRLMCQQCQCDTIPATVDNNCCQSCCCCCKVCDIIRNRSWNSSTSSSSSSSSSSPSPMSLRRRRRTAATEPHDTNHQRQPLFSSTTAPTSSTIQSQSPLSSGNYFDLDDDDNDDREQCGDPRSAGDNLCEWHKRALLLVAGIPEADLVYAQFNNRLSSVPYCIMLDHERSLVILSVRGSLSLEDVVTDTLVLPEPLDDLGDRYGFDGRGQYCHAGVLACFENVLRDLQRYGWLERLLERDYPNYNLRIVGHSLGAGVCTLLGYVLRSKFPSLKVFGFSPPGCTMTWELATGCDSWATTFILDNDIVPRLSVLALEDLRNETLELIGRIKVPKYKIFETFLKGRDGRKGCLYGSDGRNDSSNASYYDEDLDDLTQIIDETLDDVPRDTIYQRQLQDFLRVQHERKEARGETSRLKLFPPGRMIHLLKTGEEGGCAHLMNKCMTCCTSNSGFVYTPVYIANDDLDEIVVNATMGTDHFIDRMKDELHKTSKNYSDQGATTGVDHNVDIGHGTIV